MMTYLILLGLIVTCVIVAMTSLIFGVIAAINKRWRAVFACVAAILLSGTLITGASIWLGYRAAASVAQRTRSKLDAWKSESEERTKAAAVAQHDAILRRAAGVIALTPEKLRAGIDDQFWSTDGEFDWYRRPLRFPYAIIALDTRDYGTLCINSTHGVVDANNEPSVVSDITHYSFDATQFLCRVDASRWHPAAPRWMIVNMDTFDQKIYPIEQDMLTAARAAGFSGKLPLQSVKDQHEDYWK